MGSAFTGVLANNGIAISMDGKGAWRDNVFVERLWRSVKHEEVYLRAYDTVAEARNSLAGYFSFYNSRRPHSSLDRQTPDHSPRFRRSRRLEPGSSSTYPLKILFRQSEPPHRSAFISHIGFYHYALNGT